MAEGMTVHSQQRIFNHVTVTSEATSEVYDPGAKTVDVGGMLGKTPVSGKDKCSRRSCGEMADSWVFSNMSR